MFRFTIRDLLWLMVVVGLGVGWIVDREMQFRKLVKHRQETNEAAHKRGLEFIGADDGTLILVPFEEITM